jgi:acyl carrier protein
MAEEPSAHRAATMGDPRVPEILDIVARETTVDRGLLQPEATIEALGIPSLDMVQTVFALETRFGVEIPVVSDRAGAAEFVTVGDLVAHVLTTLDRAAPAS